MNTGFFRVASVAIASLCLGQLAQAADWSDTAFSLRAGSNFREPFNPDAVGKRILAVTHASGYKYGSNFFNVDFLQSDSKDPASLREHAGAREAYLVYRHTLDLGKVSAADLKVGPVRGAGLTFGVDWNAKNDVGYNSRKRMFVAGPTLMWDVPGHLNTSVLLLRESNAPSGAFAPISTVAGRYTYQTHPMLSADWAIALGALVSLEGYANFIASKGRDEVGNATGAETNIDLQLMFDVGAMAGWRKHAFRAGLEYQYWNNKFGNTAATTGGKGYRANTPMLRADYHF